MKAVLKELIKLKAKAEVVAAKKKTKEDKKTILDTVEKSAKSVEEILGFLKVSQDAKNENSMSQ